MWGGVLSEVGIENITIGSSGFGKPYQDFQKFLLMLHNRGVILTICSKNNEADVLRVFREHSDMILSEEHIACFRVNWDTKAVNIKNIATALNIGLDSMVFIDDSDFEIEAIQHILPEVMAVQYEQDRIYEAFSCFNLKNNIDIDDIRKRHATYKTDEYRRKLKNQCQTFDDYLISLDMKVDIHEAVPFEYARISELTQRTNRMTNGIRYTIEELKTHVEKPEFILYSVSVSDRFSNLGIVGAIAVENDELQLFCLSCRAMGRNVEQKMIDYIIANHCVQSVICLSTGKNEELHKMLLKLTKNLDSTLLSVLRHK